MLPTLFQWIHVTAAVIGIGGMGFVLIVLLPALRAVESDQREALVRKVLGRFRWVSWAVIFLLLASGIYNAGLVWEAPWGTYWKLLTLKIVLALVIFAIVLCLTLPIRFLEAFRARRRTWLMAAFTLGVIVILISAYLRRG